MRRLRRPKIYEHDVTGIRIRVVCGHRHLANPGREKMLHLLRWSVDAELEDLFRRKPSANPQATDVVIVNDRLGHIEQELNRHGRVTRFASPERQIDPLQWDEAGALNYFRFACSRCGMDVPARKDRLNEWIEKRVEEEPNRGVFTFDISVPSANLK